MWVLKCYDNDGYVLFKTKKEADDFLKKIQRSLIDMDCKTLTEDEDYCLLYAPINPDFDAWWNS